MTELNSLASINRFTVQHISSSATLKKIPKEKEKSQRKRKNPGSPERGRISLTILPDCEAGKVSSGMKRRDRDLLDSRKESCWCHWPRCWVLRDSCRNCRCPRNHREADRPVRWGFHPRRIGCCWAAAGGRRCGNPTRNRPPPEF